MGHKSFMGNDLPYTIVRSLRDMTYEKHTNTLTLKNLPSLRRIYSSGDYNFHFVGIVNIESRLFYCL